MKKMAFVKKALSFVMVVALMLCTFPVGNVFQVSAEDVVTDWVDGSMETAYIYNRGDGANNSHLWWPDWITVSDGSNGGLNLSFTGAFTNVREGLIAAARPLHGFKAVFNNFTVPADAYCDNFALLFSTATPDTVSYDQWNYYAFALVFDVAQGRVIFNRSGDVLLTNEKLLKDNISGKEISILFKETTKMNYQLYITVGDEALPVANIPYSILYGYSAILDNCSMSVTAWGDGSNPSTYQTFSIDLMGVGTVETEKIDEGTDVFVVPSLENALLYNSETGKNPNLWWSQDKFITISNAQNGGLKVNFANAFTDIRETIVSKPFSLHGLRIKLADFALASGATASQGKFAITFSNFKGDLTHSNADAFIFNPEDGSISAYWSREVIIQNDLLKAENIAGKEIVLDFNETEDGNYVLYVTVGGTQLPVAKLFKASTFQYTNYDFDNLQFGIMAWTGPNNEDPNKTNCSIDFTYLGNVEAEISEEELVYVTPSLENSFLYNKEDDQWCYNKPNLYWDANQNITISNSSTGGLNFIWKNALTNVREGIVCDPLKLHGLNLKFDNFSLLNGANSKQGKFAFLLGNDAKHPAYNTQNTIAIVVNTELGKITAYPAARDIVKNDALLANNITGKSFSFEFRKTTAGDYALLVKVGETILPAGRMSKDLFATVDTENLYCSLTAWNREDTLDSGDINCSVDFTGLGNVEADVYNYDLIVPNKENCLVNSTTGGLTTTNIEDGTGLIFAWNDSSTDSRDGVAVNSLSLHGLKAVFNNLTVADNAAADQGKFALYISNDNDITYAPASPLALVFDVEKGRIVAYPSGITVLEDAALLRDNLKGKKFSVEIAKTTANEYNVMVVVDGVVLPYGKITAKMLESAIGLTDYDNCSVLLSAWNGETKEAATQTFSLEYKGLGNVYADIMDAKYYTVKKEDSIFEAWHSAWASYYVVNDLPDKNGVSLRWVNAPNAYREAMSVATSLDGLSLNFGKFIKYDTDNGKILFGLTTTANEWFDFQNCQSLGIVLDTIAGNITVLDLSNRENTVFNLIENNPALQYRNMASKPFTLNFNKVETGYELSVVVEGENEVSGIISNDFISSFAGLEDSNNVMVGISPYEGTMNAELHYYGIGNVSTQQVDILTNVDNTVASGVTIKGNSGGGIKAVWSELSNPNNIITSTNTFDLNGLSVLLDGLRYNIGGKENLALYIGNEINFEGEKSPLMITVNIDGSVSLAGFEDSVELLSANEILKYTNIRGKKLAFTFNKMADLSYSLEISVGEDSVFINIPYENISNTDTYSLEDLSNVKVAFGSAQGLLGLPVPEEGMGATTMQFNLNGYKNAEKTIGDVNGDGEENILDLVRLKKHLAYVDTVCYFSGADCTQDNEIDIDDLVEMRKIMLGIKKK